MKTILKSLAGLFALSLVVGATALAAQEMSNLPQASEMSTQSLRPYWHVFIAYAIAIVAVLAWVISMSRRLAGLQAQLGE